MGLQFGGLIGGAVITETIFARIGLGRMYVESILNKDITGRVHRDRKLLTGDSPLASNNLGKLAADALLAEAASQG